MTSERNAHTSDRMELDGNAAAGDFSNIFANDVTTVTIHCDGCGAEQLFAQARVYLGGPGTVLRCRGCDAILARLARTPRGTWLDLSGSRTWMFTAPV
ncbi:DUF6510 family protein [Cumulibacter soli]|uniref:DUF6510 family protein n=1 Tax=Cumulibacter soli TaxID=2546344 RepID=UPI001ABA6BF9|nr:DUF6510 family protein [Cumulibacter soli]